MHWWDTSTGRHQWECMPMTQHAQAVTPAPQEQGIGRAAQAAAQAQGMGPGAAQAPCMVNVGHLTGPPPPPPVMGQQPMVTGDLLERARVAAEQAHANYVRLEALEAERARTMAQDAALAVAAGPAAHVPGPRLPPEDMRDPMSWPVARRTMFLGSLPGYTSADDIRAIGRACNVTFEQVHLFQAGGSGLRSARVVPHNPAWNMRTLLLEVHGHLSDAQ